MSLQTITQQGETLDYLCHRMGLGSSRVEEVYAMNRGLANYGPILPGGIIVRLPTDVAEKRVEKKLVNLWD